MPLKKRFSFQSAKEQERLSQKNPFWLSFTAEPQRGQTPITSLSSFLFENIEKNFLSGCLCVHTSSRTISLIPSIKLSALSSPRSICKSCDSHSAVRSGDLMLSGRIVIKSTPFCVGSNSFFFLSTKPVTTSFSRIAARVAGVPKPFRSASSGVSSAPAVSIAESRESSV